MSKVVKESAAGSRGVPLSISRPWGHVCCVYVQTSLCLCCTNTHAYGININWHVIDLSEKSYKSAISPLTP